MIIKHTRINGIISFSKDEYGEAAKSKNSGKPFTTAQILQLFTQTFGKLEFDNEYKQMKKEIGIISRLDNKYIDIESNNAIKEMHWQMKIIEKKKPSK